MKSGKQEHEGASFITWHLLLSPHGEGTQGFTGLGGSAAVDKIKNAIFQQNKKNIIQHALFCELLTFYVALSERITRQFGGTRANWIVINYGTLSSDATGSGAGVYAFLIVAGHVGRTIGTDNTLSSAIRWSVQIIRNARADSLLVYLSTYAIRSAR